MIDKIKEKIANIFLFFVKLGYKIIRKEFTPDDRHVWLQFFGFAIVGCSNFVVQYAVYSLCYRFLPIETEVTRVQVANICGFVISVLNAFYWNNRLVFKTVKTKKDIVFSLLKTYMSYAFTGLLLNAALLYMEVDVLKISAYVAPFINLLITTPINFFLNKLWAFKDNSGMKKSSDNDTSEN